MRQRSCVPSAQAGAAHIFGKRAFAIRATVFQTVRAIWKIAVRLRQRTRLPILLMAPVSVIPVAIRKHVFGSQTGTHFLSRNSRDLHTFTLLFGRLQESRIILPLNTLSTLLIYFPVLLMCLPKVYGYHELGENFWFFAISEGYIFGQMAKHSFFGSRKRTGFKKIHLARHYGRRSYLYCFDDR